MQSLVPTRLLRLLPLIVGVSLAAFFIFQFFHQKRELGILRVNAPDNGAFEIYRIQSESPLQIESELVGQFNEDINLSPGQYLVLADCSSKTVIIHPGERDQVTAHQVQFTTPHEPKPEDKFSIQCNRYSELRSRQSLTNRYSLTILEDKRDLLVGMVPLVIDFSKYAGMPPQRLNYKLSAIQVADYEKMSDTAHYFVSPVGGMLAVTETQEFGRWQFLMPGKYNLEVNGTRLDVELKEGEERVIQPAFLRVNTPKSTDLELSSQIRGNPLFVQLNQEHWLDLDEVYPVLPGAATISINGSFEPYPIELEEGKLFEKSARMVIIHSDCAPWEWSCLGNTPVFLYEKGKIFPFSEGVTDVPMLFFKDTEIYVGIQGSRDVRYYIPGKQITTSLNVGKIKFIPTYASKPGIVTDLIRVETPGSPLVGQTLDIPLDHESEMTIFTGNYYLAQYNSSTHIDGDRRRSRDNLNVRLGQMLQIPVTVYVSDKKLPQLQEVRKKSEHMRERRQIAKLGSRFNTAIQTQME